MLATIANAHESLSLILPPSSLPAYAPPFLLI